MAHSTGGLSPIAQVVAGLLRGEPSWLSWEQLDELSFTEEEFAEEIREVSKNAGVKPYFLRLEKPRITVVFNEEYPPAEEVIHGYVAQAAILREQAAERASEAIEPGGEAAGDGPVPQ